MPASFETLKVLDEALEASGHHPLTPFWERTLKRWYASKATTLVGRVGRGGAKSHTSTKIACNEVLFGDWSIPPGEVHYWAFVSARKEEAEQRTLLIESFLRALGIKFDVKGSTIRLRGIPRGFKVFVCNVGSVSGFRCIGYAADELAKWNSEGVNPAAEVCASLSAMTVTHPGARALLISSPLGLTDYHATRFDRGDTDDQMVAHAASWVANPASTEEQTRQKEPDERVWAREYAAIPGSGITDDWFGAGLGLSLVNPLALPTWQPWMRTFVALDPAFAEDRFGWAVVTSVARDGKRQTVVHEAGSWKPDRAPGAMAARVRSELCAKYGVGEDETKRVYTDQFEGYSFTELARREGLFLEVINWSGGSHEGSKATRFKQVRLAMLQGEFRMPDQPELVKQFRSVKGVLLATGSERIEVKRSLEGHGDTVSAIVLAASVALSLPAQQAYVEPQALPEQVRMKQEAERRMMAKRAREMERPGYLAQRLRSVR